MSDQKYFSNTTSSSDNNQRAQGRDNDNYGRPPDWLLRLTDEDSSNSRCLPQNPTRSFNPFAAPFVPRSEILANNPVVKKTTERLVIYRGDDASKETLRDRLAEQLERETYECMICCQSIMAIHWIWTCRKCFHMFHYHRKLELSCITRWASKSFDPTLGGWRCPSCQHVNATLPNEYRCFCGQELQPRTRRGSDLPHSCGAVCRKSRDHGCPHACTLPCHPGPCPPCPRISSTKCLCANETQSVRCGVRAEIKCSKVCGKLLNCGQHFCTVVCHSGDCDSCQLTMDQVCFCFLSTRHVPCTSAKYSCGLPCPFYYDCQKHRCQSKCHPNPCGHCRLSPSKLTHCPCGNTELTVLRNSCQDPVPTCDKKCLKVLKCGFQEKPHRCQFPCHVGACPACPNNSSIRCRCMSSTKTVPCSELPTYTEPNGKWLCERRCKRTKSCRQHKCSEKCCVDRDHLCVQMCNRILDCGIHHCEMLCHAGQCRRCLQAGFQEQHCLCGCTVREPPIPCGALLPPCNQLCTRRHDCQHDVVHQCHSETDCPPCVYLTSKWCYGRHELRNNIPCYLQDVSCGRPCAKLLPCDVHYCTRTCHPDECQQKDGICKQPCTRNGQKKCGHPCTVQCHGSGDCPTISCTVQVTITCPCGRKTQSMSCCEVDKLHNRVQTADALHLDSNSVSNNSEQSGVKILKRDENRDRLQCLTCDKDCSRIRRNRNLASALGLQIEDKLPASPGSEPLYTDFLKSQVKCRPSFVLDVETALVQLVKSTEAQCHNMTRNHVFRPMSSELRKIIHEYSSYFLIESATYDPEPQRNVVITAKRGHSFIPSILLSSLIQQPKIVSKMVPPPVDNAWKMVNSPQNESMQTLNPATAIRRIPNSWMD